jgi:hypothetical protein
VAHKKLPLFISSTTTTLPRRHFTGLGATAVRLPRRHRRSSETQRRHLRVRIPSSPMDLAAPARYPCLGELWLGSCCCCCCKLAQMADTAAPPHPRKRRAGSRTPVERHDHAFALAETLPSSPHRRGCSWRRRWHSLLPLQAQMGVDVCVFSLYMKRESRRGAAPQ